MTVLVHDEFFFRLHSHFFLMFFYIFTYLVFIFIYLFFHYDSCKPPSTWESLSRPFISNSNHYKRAKAGSYEDAIDNTSISSNNCIAWFLGDPWFDWISCRYKNQWFCLVEYAQLKNYHWNFLHLSWVPVHKLIPKKGVNHI